MRKICQACGQVFERRPNERNWDWNKRVTCGKICGGTLPKERKCDINDPADWPEVAQWLREQGAFDVPEPVKTYSRAEIDDYIQKATHI